MRGRVGAVIIYIKCCRNRLRGFRAVIGQKWGVLYWLWQSPLQHVSTTVLPRDSAALSQDDGLQLKRPTCDFLTFQTLVRKLQNFDRSGSIKVLCETLMSWGDIWITVGQASSMDIDQMIDQWRFRVGKWVWASGRQLKTFDDMFYYCTALLVHTFSHFGWRFM